MRDEEWIADPELADLLRRERRSVEVEWAHRLAAVPGSRYPDRTSDELLAWSREGVDAIIESLEAGDPSALESHASRIVTVRRDLGFGIGEVIDGLLRFRGAAMQAVRRHLEPGSAREIAAAERLEARARLLSARFGEMYSVAMRESIEIEKKRTEILLKATRAASESLDLEVVLGAAEECMTAALSAQSCTLFVGQEGSDTYRLWGSPGAAPASLGRIGAQRPLDPAADPVVAEAITRGGPFVRRASDPSPVLEDRSCSVLGFGSIVAVPLVAASRVAAVAVATHPERHGTFGDSSLALASGVARAVAPGIAHAQVHEELQRSLAETRTLQRITADLLGSVDLDEILERACERGQALAQAGGSAVVLRTPDRGWEVVFQAGDATGAASELLDDVLPAGRDHSPAEPVLVNDLTPTRSRGNVAAAIRSVLAIPLQVHGEGLGVIEFVNKPGGFGGDDLRLLSLISNQVAVAIEHARLHERQEETAVLEERHRISQDLHDSVTQSMYAVATLTEAATRHLRAGRTEDASSLLDQARDSALEALREMRLFLFHLFPPDIEKQGLIGALHARLGSVETRAGLKTRFLHEGVPSLPPPVEERLYRIAQEALNNTLKHAGASEVSLELRQTHEGIVFEVADDGCGFDVDTAMSSGGMGLPGILRRAEEIGGTVRVHSGSGEGTRLRIDIPASRL
jgi:signal transduction histidine kinase